MTSSAGDRADEAEGAPSTADASEKTTETTDKEKEPASSAVDAESSKPASTELPADVKAKLRRLDKLESRYHGMWHLFSFSAVLRELTL